MSIQWQDSFVQFTDDFVIWKSVVSGTATGSIEFTATANAKNYNLATASGAIEFTGSAVAHNYNIATATGSCEFTASAVGKVLKLGVTSGAIEFTATTIAHTYDLAIVTGAIEFTASAVGKVLKKATASGSIEFTGTAEGGVGYIEMTPAMHAAIIDPRSGGAWLWLAKIYLPGYDYMRIACNREDVVYSGNTYTKNNFIPQIPKLTSDGSVPRTTIRIAQDSDRTFEDKINTLQGKLNTGYVKLIRAHENFLGYFVEELEYFSNILSAKSNSQWVTLTLGMPNPLRQLIPLRVLSSKMCPWAEKNYKDIECGSASSLTTCPGFFRDCVTRNNEVRWGGELGLERR